MAIITRITGKGVIQEFQEDAPASLKIEVTATDSTGATITGGGGGGTPGGGNTHIQYNSGGSFAGSANFAYDDTAVFLSGSLIHGSGSLAASGLRSHVEGWGNTDSYGASQAAGDYSHAEGESTNAIGTASHTEGHYTTANGSHSHAEGFLTIASAQYSHAEGSGTTASGYASHTEGVGTSTSANFTHAEGNGTAATQEYAHAEGVQTTASGYGSHSEGDNTTAAGDRSHAEGDNTTSSGYASHAEGQGTIASGSYQHASGRYNLRSNDFSLFVIGNGTSDADIDRSDILRVNTDSIQVSGSFVLSGSFRSPIGGDFPFGAADLDGSSPGAVTVSNSLVSSNSVIFLTKQTLSFPSGFVSVSSKSPGSFTITSNQNGDTDTVAYFIVNPA
jgi:hypothetical protein